MKNDVRNPERGFTLIEVLTALVICGFFVMGISSIAQVANRTFNDTRELTSASQSVEFALDMMTREIREAQSVNSCTANTITITNNAGNTVSYRWNVTTIERSDSSTGSAMQTLAGNVTNLQFNYNSTTQHVIVDVEGTNNGREIKLQDSVVLRRATLN